MVCARQDLIHAAYRLLAAVVFAAFRSLGGEDSLESSGRLPVGEHIPNFSQHRLLLVEDNELNREMACGLLEESGVQLDQAEHGGIATTAAIRREARFAQLPIVAMTANAMSADRERCLAAGMNDHLGKPIDPAEMWRTLERWLPAQDEPRVATRAHRTDVAAGLITASLG